MSLLRYFHTLKYLKTEQLFFQVYYKISGRMRRLFSRTKNTVCVKRGCPVRMQEFPVKQTSYRGDRVFCFLNLQHRFDGAWDCSLHGSLWRYNLNYMDFLLQEDMDAVTGYGWIADFIESSPANSIANDSYPISLRGINWIKFISLHHDELSAEQQERIDSSLYAQYDWLAHHTERHLLANHYLENGFSLLFAAVYFKDASFWKRSRRIVVRQLEEQILTDGGHYELSPMYHCVILERLLDCCNLLAAADDKLFEGQRELEDFLREKATEMLAWMDAVVVNGDMLPLLNDAANGVALKPSVLRDYAKRLHVQWKKGMLGESGYRHVVKPSYEMVVDMAPLGVSYNLGHGHADTSTFLLWVNGRALLADTGTSTYNEGERRCFERSTRAHNAVVIDGADSSKVWGAFRCAQRAHVKIVDETPMSYALVHDGYKDKGVMCRRNFVCEEDRVEIVDTVSANRQCEAVAYFYLAPDVHVQEITSDCVATDRALMHFKGARRVQIVQVEVAEEYNMLLPTHCVKVAFGESLHTIIDDFK